MSPFLRGVLVAGGFIVGVAVVTLLAACTKQASTPQETPWIESYECRQEDSLFEQEYARCVVECTAGNLGTTSASASGYLGCPNMHCLTANAIATRYGELCTPPGSVWMEVPSTHPDAKWIHGQNQRCRDQPTVLGCLTH